MDLVLLTEGFPYGVKSEPFLESEIGFLAARFDRVFILPSRRDEGARAIPSNVSVVDMPWLTPPTRSARLRALVSTAALRVLVETWWTSPNRLGYLKSPRMYLEVLAANLLKAGGLQRFVMSYGLSEAVFYDYWLENSTLALALVRRRGVIRHAVARAHRFDIYDEDWGGLPVPFREIKLRELDLVAPISQHGLDYLRTRAGSLADRTRLFRLGVLDHGESMGVPNHVPLVVSCGSLISRKRIHLLPEVLSTLDQPVRWVHFGDGPERRRVQEACEALPDRVTWELRGQVSNTEVLDFYRHVFVDLFLSVSQSEGIPVSMMEAQSFGIPIVAVGGQGIPELVNETTGVLVREDGSTDDLAAAVTTALAAGAWDREAIRAAFFANYFAETNHGLFVDALIELAS